MSDGNEDLRSLVETNFKFLAITMRDIAGRSNQTEAKLLGVQEKMKTIEQDLSDTADLTRQNREDFERMADRLDQAVAALGTLAVSGAEHRQRFESIERRLDALEGKPTDEAS
jgi:chromosome segregation ATPase